MSKIERKIKKAGTYWERLLLENEKIGYELFGYNKEINMVKKKEIFKKYVEVVIIETSTKCNRTCSYCPLSYFDRGKTQIKIDEELFEKIINELKEIKYNSTIVLNLYNEPLLDEKIIENIEKIKCNLPEAYVMFNSNGDYLTKNKLEKLKDVGNNAVFITLHANNEYDDKIQLLRIEEFIKKLDLEILKKTIVPNKSITIESEYKEMQIKIMANNWEKYGSDRAGTIKKLEKKEIRENPCMRPIREFTIYQDGSVYPCCQFFPENKELMKLRIGNINDESIFEIYSNEKLINFRKNMFNFSQKLPPCSSCKDEDNAEKNSNNIRMKIINNK